MSLPPNFCFPVPDLSSDKVKLTPFDITKHSAPLIASTAPHPSLFNYLSWDPFPTADAFNTHFFDAYMTPSDDRTCFAVLDKTASPSSPSTDPQNEDYALAGMITLMNASPVHRSAEIGWVLTLPNYQRTHVTTHAIGLLLRYALESPAQGGLGLRRVQWIAHSENEASVRAAKRMGLRVEGVLRWHRVIVGAEERGKVGGREVGGDGYGRVEDRGRDSVVLSVCWDDWIEEVDEAVGGGLFIT
ncbi:acyl-CoA N-acyltransferase [Aspergillus steynii IBT 23096]|uniref:Acyl-CoA N-acyltransferase n=1 Tax=Aspergillus steynii IBT 23096 TaxID=1392250 RepID=A0A2I2GCP2_9EURO|nr:acyl-CoA N-acyltransferase [Aspergillus steynii IBT 23096]PLB50640.1 acyl-CoA N-acyltransferase [Aspergillus steynii IBT 23096]